MESPCWGEVKGRRWTMEVHALTMKMQGWTMEVIISHLHTCPFIFPYGGSSSPLSEKKFSCRGKNGGNRHICSDKIRTFVAALLLHYYIKVYLRMKKLLFYAVAISFVLTACMSNGNQQSENSEVVIRESDMMNQKTSSSTVINNDTPMRGPFYKYVINRKIDENGGYEEYRLIMNLYEPNIPNENGPSTHGRLSLYVKTPENTEGIKIAQRTIERVIQIEGLTAEIEMSGTGERPIHFGGTITYDSIAHTYELRMTPPAQLEDLMENTMTLE